MRLLLLNPNSNIATTEMMREIAQKAAPSYIHIDAMTAPSGAKMITNREELEEASRIVEHMIVPITNKKYDGVIISAFGDPGLSYFKKHLACPVIGIGEASIYQANLLGPFTIVTTTEGLRTSILSMVQKTDTSSNFRGLYMTEGNPVTLMQIPKILELQLEIVCNKSINETNCKSVIIGGGPLGLAARSLKGKIRAHLIEPIPAAVRMISTLF
jgi:allantoin racemase